MIDKEAIENAYQRYLNEGPQVRPILQVGKDKEDMDELLSVLHSMGFKWNGGTALTKDGYPPSMRRDDDTSLFLNESRRVTHGSCLRGSGMRIEWRLDDDFTEEQKRGFMADLMALYQL